jgi:hypothetical protein
MSSSHDAPSSSGGAAAESQTGESPISVRNVVVSVVLSAAVLGGIAYWTFDAAAFRAMVAQMDVWILGVAVLTTALRVWLGGWRLSHVSGGRLDKASGTRGQLAWEFFSNVTPSAIGGGPVTALYVARDRRITVGEATAFMLFSMLLDQLWIIVAIPVILLATLYLEIVPASVGSLGLWSVLGYFAVLLTWASVFAYATLVRPSLLERLADRIFQWNLLARFRSRVMREMRTFTRRARRIRSQPFGFYAKGFLLTALTWIGRYLLVFFIVRSVYPTVDGVLLVFRTAAMTLIGLAMPTPGGSGGLEGLYALFLGPLMPSALVAPTLLTWRLLGYYVFIAIGAYLFTHQVHRELRRRASEPSPPASDVTAQEVEVKR